MMVVVHIFLYSFIVVLVVVILQFEQLRSLPQLVKKFHSGQAEEAHCKYSRPNELRLLLIRYLNRDIISPTSIWIM